MVEASLWTLALLCASYCFVLYGRSQSLMQATVGTHVKADVVHESGSLIGRLEIPELQLSVPILEDDEAQSLDRGVGHIRGTAVPGGLGTVGLAGHRDTFLRPLSGITPKMEIRLSSASGVYHYIVDSTEIVLPEAVNVLDIENEPKLVLITCFPFHYVGAAPKRFIVHAHLVSLIPDQESRSGSQSGR